MAAILTAEDIVRHIAAEYAYVDERGGVGIRLEPAAAIVRQYGEQPHGTDAGIADKAFFGVNFDHNLFNFKDARWWAESSQNALARSRRSA
jgi:hypothetical protein